MTDFHAMAGASLKDRLSRHLDTIADLDRETENLKAQRKEALSAAEAEDKLNARALSALAKLQRTGKMTAPVEVWPSIEAYADTLGIVLPGSDKGERIG